MLETLSVSADAGHECNFCARPCKNPAPCRMSRLAAMTCFSLSASANESWEFLAIKATNSGATQHKQLHNPAYIDRHVRWLFPRGPARGHMPAKTPSHESLPSSVQAITQQNLGHGPIIIPAVLFAPHHLEKTNQLMLALKGKASDTFAADSAPSRPSTGCRAPFGASVLHLRKLALAPSRCFQGCAPISRCLPVQASGSNAGRPIDSAARVAFAESCLGWTRSLRAWYPC